MTIGTDTSTVRTIFAGLCVVSSLAISACADSDGEATFETRSAPIQSSPTADTIPNQYIVQTTSGTSPGAVGRSVASAHGGEVTHTYGHALNGFAIRLPEQAADQARRALHNNPKVETVEQDLEAQAIGQTLPTGVDRIEADQNSTAQIDGTDQRVDIDVAIIDTGIDRNHADLNVAGGVNFADGGETEWDDGHGHGTHVAGTVGALDNDRDVVGVAPGASMWGLRVLSDDGSGSWSAILNAIDWVTRNADTIEVANMSLGGTGQLSSARTALQNSIEAGVVYTVAAGNNSVDVYGSDDTLGTSDDFIPAAYPEVAAISAMRDEDGSAGGDEFASFSNFSESVVDTNPVSSPGAAIDLMLPGVYIESTQAGGGTTSLSGTSMASPHAAGLVALEIASAGTRDVDGDGTVDSSDVYQIRQKLIDQGVEQDSAEGLSTLNDPDSNWEQIGWAASSTSDAAPSASWLGPADGTTVSDSTDISIDASDSEDSTGTLQVEWRLDGGSWRSTSYDSGTATYRASWDTSQVADGTHTLEGRAVDSAGHVTGTSSVDVTVDNTTDTDTAPTASWLAPADGTTVSDSTDISIDASDSEDSAGTLQVEWRLDGGSWRSTSYDSGTATYRASWDTSQAADGTHTLEGRAVDSAGHVTGTSSADVTVDNATDDGGDTLDGAYVWAIDFSQRSRGKGGAKRDLRTYVTMQADTDGDGTAESSDGVLKDARVEVVLTRDADGDGTFECGGDDPCTTYTDTTNGQGEMKFNVKNIATGRYQAEVTAVTTDTATWASSLDADNPDTFLVD